MDQKSLSSLLDRIYELEGLVHLALARDDNPAGLARLVADKAAAVADAASVLGSEVAVEVDTYPEAPAEEAEMPEAPESVAAPGFAGDAGEYADDTVYEETLIEEDARETAPEEEPVCREDAACADTPAEAAPAYEEKDVPTVEKAPAIASVTRTLNDEAAPRKPTVNDSARGRLVFSLNDRFRFRRTLFGGNDNVFGSTLGEVAAMENYEEAENYFYGELQWQPDNAEVAEFMRIIKSYFEA